jgi:hypothetical protein
MQPNKAKVYIFRMTIGGDRLDAYQDVCSTAVSILYAKIHMNIAISDANNGARYCTADRKFFFCSKMEKYQFMQINFASFPWRTL